MNLDCIQVVVNQINKKLYYVEGLELRCVCERMSNGIMHWARDIMQIVKGAYPALMTSR